MERLIRQAAFIFLIFTSTTSHAQWFDGVMVSGGQDFHSNAHLNSYRIALTRDWNSRWFNEGDWHVGGYFDLSVNHWKSRLSDGPGTSVKGKDSISALAFSPVFRITRNSPWFGTFTPFAEAGIGLSMLSGSRLKAKNNDSVDLGIKLQFEDRIGLGFSFGDRQQYSVVLRAFHYSNANFHKENDGFNLQELAFGWKF
ncbi:acyloxyacyl hydrolase [Sansalvadorimonas sp. 2012CJ34-2]|uniref:Lipid A deacylase n=1 Tax=Parendozoicomonas callyspongiae TaxID=2942213 RepID=A0ABT0PL98_9GAMM|nr:acyloxyacyl hydrolase [Sansalvadorimonas sp. 2012CJ34-2]MCL6271213.1 acyloxyacyl hydrolase [Sansalvadorimonas sp. 2012CJ34-2]